MNKKEWVTKLTENEQNGSCTVRARLGKTGNKTVKWSPWRQMQLHIQKNQKGEIVLITPKKPIWADYDPRQHDLTVLGNGNALFTAEDWYMEVAEIIPAPTAHHTAAP